MSDRRLCECGAINGMPMVSVIVAVYNGGRYLCAALDSVFAQNYHPMEVIVVDDGSTDDTASIAQSHPEVRYVNQEHHGVAAARNSGVAMARGNLIALQDADDLWVPGRLALQVSYLRAHPEVDGVIGLQLNFLDGTTPECVTQRLGDRVGLGTLVARRGVYSRIGGYDTEYRIGSDMEWFSRARDLGANIITLPDILTYRRIHSTNLSRAPEARTDNLLRMFKASIDRKRKGATSDEARNT